MDPLEVAPPEHPDHSVTVLCSECGSIVHVKDVQSLLLALHLTNECTLRTLFADREA